MKARGPLSKVGTPAASKSLAFNGLIMKPMMVQSIDVERKSSAFCMGSLPIFGWQHVLILNGFRDKNNVRKVSGLQTERNIHSGINSFNVGIVYILDTFKQI